MIELLVSITIFAILSAFSYSILNQSIISSFILDEKNERLQNIQRSIKLIEQDFIQIAPRPIRSELGQGYNGAITTSPTSGFALELTRSGWGNPLGLSRSNLQRVAYQMENDKLIRIHWNVLDRTLSNQFQKDILIDEIESILFTFLNENGEWIQQWPPLSDDKFLSITKRPLGIAVVINFEQEGEIRRIFEVSP
ncbi:uncharacterized protein METZ01_LOCUS12897 [marine metagenome]|uniref:Type II secretion system protein J n=1 Tax=marine metagenome TaxID=408172 RepID=A0A381P323_9ZZZZ